MKVTEINHLYYPFVGGVQNTMQQISEGLAKRDDMEIEVVTTEKEHRKGHIDEINGVKVYRLPSIYNIGNMPVSLPLIFNLKKYIKDSDIVHLHMPFPLGDLALLLSGYRGKIILWWHSDVVKQKIMMRFYYPVMQMMLKRADTIVVATEGQIRYSKYLYPYKNKCVIIPFSIRKNVQYISTQYLENKKKDKKAEGNKFRVLFVGRLVYYKGCDILLKAIAELNDPEIEVIIVGKGQMENELRKLSNKLNLNNAVSFKGQIDDEQLFEEYKKCDVFVLPSVEPSEAYALVQMEAMAFGKPVINTRLKSGVPYVSVHKETGITCRPKDVHSLVKALRWMKANPDKRKIFGENARKKVENEYIEDVMIERIYQLYKKSFLP